MSIESIAAAVAIMIGVGGALIQIIKVIVQHVTDKEFDGVSKRIARIERRLAVVEMATKGETDTFSDY